MADTNNTIPIHRMLFNYGATIAAVIVLVAGSVLGVDIWFSSKQSLERNLFTIADVIGGNSAAALMFRDSEAAKTTLETLENLQSIESALLYDDQGGVLAYYSQPGIPLAVPLELPESRRFEFSTGAAEILFPIEFDSKKIGMLYMRSSTAKMFAELRQKLGFLLLLFLVALGLAAVVARPLRRAIVEPILRLRSIADQITLDEKYYLRAPASSLEEIAGLASSFNKMIEQINIREANIRRNEEELLNLNAALRRSNAELSEFAYIASHDLQEPLRKIQTFGDRLLARHRSEVGEKAADYIERMSGAATRMRTLIDDLLTLSRVMAREREFEELDMNALLDEVLDDLQEPIQSSGAVIHRDELPAISGDYSQLVRLMQNIIGNALKYRKADIPPEIRIFTAAAVGSEELESTVEIVVEDNGIGFTQEEAEQIFKPFKRLHSREEYPGTGIGLAICAKIVERHGGDLTAHGTPGDGARFVIKLPKLQHQPSTREAAL